MTRSFLALAQLCSTALLLHYQFPIIAITQKTGTAYGLLDWPGYLKREDEESVGTAVAFSEPDHTLLFCFSVFNFCRRNVLTEPLPSNELFLVYSLQWEHAWRAVS
jgi:hypothetical protein